MLSKRTGVNAFWLAAKFGQGNIMRVLAENGINVLNTDSKGRNALHLATKKNHLNVVKMLLGSSFPMDNLTKDGKSALDISCESEDRIKITKELIKFGADVNKLSNNKICPLN